MRIERIRVDAFGRLRGLDTGAEALDRLVVVVGPNEAGKSTLFTFLTTALYGFQPASRERNPHVPWGSDEAGGVVHLKLQGVGCVEVERRLRSSPTGRITVQGRTEEVRNQPLPWVDHVPRAVFRQVFAVTLAELAGLDQETWARIQDRVVGSMGASDVRSARSVAEALERQASEIWRPNRRGRQRLRDVQERVRALRSRRLAAAERDQEIRTLLEERENVQVRLREIRAERHKDRAAVERVQELLPVRRQLHRIASLRAEGGPKEDLRELPSGLDKRIDDLRASRDRLRKRLTAIEREMSDPELAVPRFGEEDQRLLEHRDQIARFLSHAASVTADRERAQALGQETAALEFKVKAAADHLLSGGWTDAVSASFSNVSLDLLRDRVDRLRALRQLGGVPMVDSVPRGGDGATGRRVSALLLTVGLPLLAWGLAGGPIAALALGAAACAAGMTMALAGRGRGASSHDAGGVSGRGVSAADPLAAATREVNDLVADVPIRTEYLDPPGDPLVAGVERLQALVGDWQTRSGALEQASKRVEAADSAARELAAALGRTGTPDAATLSAALEREIRDAERAQDAARAAERERARLGRERDDLLSEAAENEAALAALDAALSKFGGGNATDGLRAAESRIEAHRRAGQLEEELERGHPDLAELTARIEASDDSGQSWTMDDAYLATRRTRIEELEETIEALVARSEALERDAAHLRELETVDAVDGEIADLQESEARLVRERDRKWILAQLVREADRRFREEHQPDLVRRASSYLEHLTGGRYDKLLVDETSPEGLFQLFGPGMPAPISLAPPVSTGTLEQAYLSLRLAIVDHLDHGQARLPLFIDEAFVNWDRTRRDRGLEVLVELSKTRQLFVFTCHPEVGDRLKERGARVLQLEGTS